MKSYPITPVPAPRMTQADRRPPKRPAVARYHAFQDECRLYRVDLKPGDSVEFVLPMPQSWSKRKKLKMAGKPHEQKPDLDNLLKALQDSVLPEDKHMWKYSKVEKRWGVVGGIVIIAEGEAIVRKGGIRAIAY